MSVVDKFEFVDIHDAAFAAGEIVALIAGAGDDHGIGRNCILLGRNCILPPVLKIHSERDIAVGIGIRRS